MMDVSPRPINTGIREELTLYVYRISGEESLKVDTDLM